LSCATLVTDDYAMQNVAERLDISVEAIARDGITEERANGGSSASAATGPSTRTKAVSDLRKRPDAEDPA